MLLDRSLLHYFLGKIAPALSSLFLIVAGARYLGEAEYGYSMLIFGTVTTLGTLFSGWFQQGLLRYSAKPASSSVFLNPLYRRTIIGLATLCALVNLIWWFGVREVGFTTALLSALLGFAWCIFILILTVLQASFQSSAYSMAESLQAFLFMAVFLGMSASLDERTHHVCLIAWVISYLLGAGGGFRLGLKKKEMKAIESPAPSIKELREFGLPMTLWLFLAGALNIADRYFISSRYGMSETGTYSLAYDLVFKVAAFSCLPILLSLHPKISRFWNSGDKAKAVQAIASGIKAEIVLMLGMLLTFFIFGRFLFTVVIKTAAPDPYRLLLPLILSAMIWQIAQLVHKRLEMQFQTTRMIGALFLSLLVNGLLNHLLMPRFPWYIAAWTNLAAVVVYTLLVSLPVKNSENAGAVH